MMMDEQALKEKVIECLHSIYDPEIPVNIYELGLIYEINILPINNVQIVMTLTSPACPARNSGLSATPSAANRQVSSRPSADKRAR